METKRPSRPGQPQPRRILVRGVNWLGDAVMSSPALQRLRERVPESSIVLLTPDKIADLWRDHPSVDQVLTFTFREPPWSVARRLRADAFDCALIFPNSPRSALEAWLAGIPERIGFTRPWRDWFLTQALPSRAGRVPMRKRTVREIRRLTASGKAPVAGSTSMTALPDPASHHIHDYLYLAASLGAEPAPAPPKFQVSTEEIRKAEEQLTAGLSPRPAVFAGLNPSAAYGSAKRWPAERFAAVAREVTKVRTAVTWVIFGSAEDRSLCQEVAANAGPNALNLAGKTSLRDLMALLSLCQVVLTNDTGPMHLAAALGTPVVVPFGSTSPELTGPGLPGAPGHYLLQSRVPCAPCFRRVCPIDLRCLQNITVDQAVSAVLTALNLRQRGK